MHNLSKLAGTGAKAGTRWLGAVAVTVAMVTGASAASLSDDAKYALGAALDDEYHAEAVYNAVIASFGPVRPFSNIVRAEQRHQSMLIDLYQRYGIEVPANPYESGQKSVGTVPATLSEACQVGVSAEIANRDLYSKDLLPKVTQYPVITAVFMALSGASEYQHLPAFQRCAR